MYRTIIRQMKNSSSCDWGHRQFVIITRSIRIHSSSHRTEGDARGRAQHDCVVVHHATVENTHTCTCAYTLIRTLLPMFNGIVNIYLIRCIAAHSLHLLLMVISYQIKDKNGFAEFSCRSKGRSFSHHKSPLWTVLNKGTHTFTTTETWLMGCRKLMRELTNK